MTMRKRAILNSIFCYNNCTAASRDVCYRHSKLVRSISQSAVAALRLQSWRRGTVYLEDWTRILKVWSRHFDAESGNMTTNHRAADMLASVSSTKKPSDNMGLNMATYLHRLSKCLRRPTALPPVRFQAQFYDELYSQQPHFDSNNENAWIQIAYVLKSLQIAFNILGG